ncbi:YheU family protein [Motilimonas sp. KMU-193]|uniref:YheU family protein n=1 Tax=Motilimonas sp. KMU-193 TaxID=3388668 RepID=UPI00396AF9BE
MIIPYQDIQPDTLTELIEHFVLREGTEYGEQDISLADKVTQVREQLASGRVVIVYSELHESVNIIPKEQLNVENSTIDG